MPQPIQHQRTANATVATVFPRTADGEFTVDTGGILRVWLGDGAINHLLISGDPNDPLGPVVGGRYLPLVGGTINPGPVSWATAPTANEHLANKLYVDQTVSSAVYFEGAYDPATAVPPAAVPGPNTQGDFWIVTPPGTATGLAPGIPDGTPLAEGDWVIWNGTDWVHIPGGMLTVQEANGLYVELVGDTMTGDLQMAVPNTVILGRDAVAALESVTFQQLNAAIAAAGGIADGVSIGGDGTVGNEYTILLVDGGTF